MARKSSYGHDTTDTTETAPPEPSEEFERGREAGRAEEKLKRLKREGDPTGAAAALEAKLDGLLPDRAKAREDAEKARIAEHEKAIGREKEHEKAIAAKEKPGEEKSASEETTIA
jgi:hypothetical protein